jgi:hypothetical protein
MIQQFELPQSAKDPSYVHDKLDDKPGLRGERIVGEFMQECFKDIFKKVERTSQYDQNDQNGVDYVMEVANKDGQTCRFAVDITFAQDKKLQQKQFRNIRNPCVHLHDENGRAQSEELPRLLIHGGNMGFWFLQEEEAEKRGGGPLIDFMPDNEKTKKQKEILKQIMTQIVGLSRNGNYKKKVQPVRGTFEKEAERLGVAY